MQRGLDQLLGLDPVQAAGVEGFDGVLAQGTHRVEGAARVLQHQRHLAPAQLRSSHRQAVQQQAGTSAVHAGGQQVEDAQAGQRLA